MKRCIVDGQGIITNIVVVEMPEDVPKSERFYDGAYIGSAYYSGPPIPDETALLRAQVSALTQSNQILEDCLVEMAGVVYA